MQTGTREQHLESDVPRFHRAGLLLFFTALFALVGRGTLMSSDEGGIFNTAAAMTRGSLSVPPGENIHPGRDGRLYSLRETLPVVTTVPFLVTGVILERVVGVGPPPLASGPEKIGIELLDASNWPLFVTTTFLGSLCGAFTLLFCCEYLVMDGLSPRRALVLALIVGWSTPIAVYSKTIFPQIFESAMLMLCFLRARQWHTTPGMRQAWKLGVACGLGLLARPAFLPVIACFGAFLLLTGEFAVHRRARALAAFSLPTVFAVGLTLLVNWQKWGSPLDFGYHSPNESFSTNAAIGLFGLLASPGKGLLIYAPVIFVPLLFARSIFRAVRPEFLLALSVSLIYLGIYGRWYDWGGGLSWGPRFLLPLIAPWMALSGCVLSKPLNIRARRVFCTTAIVGAAVQFLGVAVYPHWIWKDTPPDPFSLMESHIVLTAKIFAQKGVDDLWLMPGRAPSPEYVAMILALLCAIMTGWVFAFKRGPEPRDFATSGG